MMIPGSPLFAISLYGNSPLNSFYFIEAVQQLSNFRNVYATLVRYPGTVKKFYRYLKSDHRFICYQSEDNTTTNLNNNSLQFVYNHTGTLTGTVNCTLYLDGNPVDYSTDVPANEDKAVYSNRSWSEGTHHWYVNCTNGTTTESSLNIGQNFSFTFTPPVKVP